MRAVEAEPRPDAVRVVTCRTRGTGHDRVQTVQRKAPIREDAGAIVAPIAQGVCLRALDGEVLRFILVREERFESRAVRPGRSASTSDGGIVAAVTVRTGNDRAHAHGGDETDDVVVAPRAEDGVE